MNKRFLTVGTLAVAIVAVLLRPTGAAGHAQRIASKVVPTDNVSRTPAVSQRTPWGDPDLQGIWTTDPMTGVPLERAKEFGERQLLNDEEFAQKVDQTKKQLEADSGEFVAWPPAPVSADAGADGRGGGTGPPGHWMQRGQPQRQTSLIIDPPDGRIPFVSPAAQQRAAAAELRASTKSTPFDGPEDLDLWDRCSTRRLPRAMLPNGEGVTFQFMQTPGYVVITYEMIHETRIIPLDGRRHLSPGIRLYFGDSRGHWEGGTLVVDVTNFNDKTKYQGTGADMHLVERFTRVDAKTIRYAFTVTDPTTFTGPWTATLDLTPKAHMIEYACHEGNYAMTHILSASRAADRAATHKQAE